jgi:hypothetical protein
MIVLKTIEKINVGARGYILKSSKSPELSPI